jgi:hypothetical protein
MLCVFAATVVLGVVLGIMKLRSRSAPHPAPAPAQGD